jgi:molybdopterin-guanine dinucleotide biosynthesis protein A
VPVVNGFEEPLHALYHRRALPAIEAALAAGQRRANSFMPAVRTRYLSEAELRGHDPALHSFFNANTPDEWAQALRLLAAP